MKNLSDYYRIIGVFVAREVMLVVLDHRKIKRKPIQKRRSYNGVYSVKKKRYVNDKNYQAVANGGNEIV
uniref:Transposase n=1 Tax=Caenorhabditis tropicalis TaxID=1561998 RepID=A0A1I7TZI6_9PELO